MNYKYNNSWAEILCLLGLFFISFVVVEYIHFVTANFKIIMLLGISFWVIKFALKYIKIFRILLNCNVVSVPSQSIFGVPMDVNKYQIEEKGKIKSCHKVTVLRPELQDLSLRFIESEHKLNKVKFVRPGKEKSHKLEIARQVSYLTKEIFREIVPQIEELEASSSEVLRLENLAKSSVNYQQQADTYARARKQFQQFINQAEQIKSEYRECIRETLIGAEISKFDSNGMSDIISRRMSLNLKYENFKSQYEFKKSEISEYYKLKAS